MFDRKSLKSISLAAIVFTITVFTLASCTATSGATVYGNNHNSLGHCSAYD